MSTIMPETSPAPSFKIPTVSGPDTAIVAELQHKIDGKTKPPGSLGEIEALALKVALIQQTLTPRLMQPHILVCAGDHGAARAGISAYPQDVTWQMVENFLAGGAAINVFARAAGIALVIADAGVNHDFGARPGLVDAKVAPGTESYLDGSAMSLEEAVSAMQRGMAIAADIHGRGCNVLGFGEMGIGNTASASLITHCLTGIALADCVGRGTGLDDAGLLRKRLLLQEAVQCWREACGAETAPMTDPLGVLARFGGYEIAMLAGAMLEAASRRMVLVIDGFIVTAALLVAVGLAPAVREYCVFAHRSEEPGHAWQLDALAASPLLGLGLRLGEGSGAALAWPLLQMAVAMLNEMASFASAGVSAATDTPS